MSIVEAANMEMDQITLAGSVMPRLNQPAMSRVKAELRRAVDGMRLLSRIERVTILLESGYERLYDPDTGRLGDALPLTAARVSALGKVLDAQFRLLNKVLPDLKAVELSGPDGAPLTSTGQPDKMVLATKLVAVLRDMRSEDASALKQGLQHETD